MRSVVVISICLAVCLCAGTDGHAFSIVEQEPNIDRFQNFTVRPMRVVFDASIDTSTVSVSTVFIHEEGDPSAELAVQFSFDTESIVDDTLVITPTENDGRWPFAERLVLNMTAGLADTGGMGFDGAYPWGQVFVANIPNDMDVLAAWDPTDPFDFVDAFVNANVLVGYNPLDPENTDLSRPETIPGMGATEAWKLTAGRPDVLIAVVDDGSERYDYAELEENYFLNRGELPAPTNGGAACPPDP